MTSPEKVARVISLAEVNIEAREDGRAKSLFVISGQIREPSSERRQFGCTGQFEGRNSQKMRRGDRKNKTKDVLCCAVQRG